MNDTLAPGLWSSLSVTAGRRPSSIHIHVAGLLAAFTLKPTESVHVCIDTCAFSSIHVLR